MYKLEIAVMGNYKRRILKRPRDWYEVLKTFAKIALLLIFVPIKNEERKKSYVTTRVEKKLW